MLSNMDIAVKAPANPSGHTPKRRLNSIRRTSTISTHWPDGFGEPMVMEGHARDILTDNQDHIEILAEDSFRILSSARREILAITVSPDRPEAQKLVGCRAGGQSRAVLAEVLPEEKAAGTPLYLLLDDFAGASLVAGWVWSRWVEDWRTLAREKGSASTAGKNGRMEGICAGFRPGSSALADDGSSKMSLQSFATVPSLVNPDDPKGWPYLPKQEGVGKRRSRWIDIWMEGGKVQMDIGFQDSGTTPEGDHRVAIHEYRVRASADPDTLELASIEVDPRILPFRECPAASPNASAMLGTPLGQLREAVLAELKGTAGCTHLNDVLRSMAEVPQLVKHLGST
jgi:DUF2889 family protein